MKTCLRKALGCQVVSAALLSTLLKEVEAILNERPLTYDDNAPESPRPLRPKDFLVPDVAFSLPPGMPNRVGFSKDFMKAWRSRERVLGDFWKRWRQEYLLQLKSAHRKGRGQCPQLSVGDVVLLESALPRHYWSLGRIIEVFPGRDGIVRRCRVTTGTGTFERAVKQLHLLAF